MQYLIITNLNELASEIFKYRKAEGLWDGPAPEFGDKTLEVTNKMFDALTSHRDGKTGGGNLLPDMLNAYPFYPPDYKNMIQGGFEDNLAGALILLLDLCAYYKIDIGRFVAIKMKYDQSQPKG